MKRFFYLMQRYNEGKLAEQYQTAMICSTVLNANLEKFKRKEPFTPNEILGIKKEVKQDMKTIAEVWTALKGGDTI